MANSSIALTTLVFSFLDPQTPGEPTFRTSGRVFPSVKLASPCSFTGDFTGYFTGPIRLRHCRLNALDRSREARWNVLQTRARRERTGTLLHGASLTGPGRSRVTMKCSVLFSRFQTFLLFQRHIFPIQTLNR